MLVGVLLRCLVEVEDLFDRSWSTESVSRKAARMRSRAELTDLPVPQAVVGG